MAYKLFSDLPPRDRAIGAGIVAMQAWLEYKGIIKLPPITSEELAELMSLAEHVFEEEEETCEPS